MEDRICVSANQHLSFFDSSGHKFLVTLEFGKNGHELGVLLTDIFEYLFLDENESLSIYLIRNVYFNGSNIYRSTESNIDVLAWSEDGNIVAVGEQNGCLHFIDANTQRPFLSKVCRNSDFWFIRLILENASGRKANMYWFDQSSDFWENILLKEECIPVGCVPSTAVAVS